MERRRILLLFAVVVIAATIIISAIATQFLLQPNGDAKGGAFEMSAINAFPRNLVLYGTMAKTYQYPYSRYLLLDEDTVYPNPACDFPVSGIWGDRWDYAYRNVTLTSIVKTVYNRSFVYAKFPIREYYILGMPSVSLDFTVDVGKSSKEWDLWYYVSLWKISPGGNWVRIINFGTKTQNYTAYSYLEMTYYDAMWFSFSAPTPIWIAPNERLALRITVQGAARANQDVSILLTHNFNMSRPNEFVVDLPIVEP